MFHPPIRISAPRPANPDVIPAAFNPITEPENQTAPTGTPTAERPAAAVFIASAA